MRELSVHQFPLQMGRVIVLLLAGLAIAGFATSDLLAQSPRDDFIAAKRVAYDANYRNDQAGLRDAIGRFERLASDQQLAAPALYYAAWSRWVLAASELVAAEPAKAGVTLNEAAGNLKAALELRPDDAETHALSAWVLTAIAFTDRTKWAQVAPEVAAHRSRAVALEPRNPRVMIMDGTMIFYTPAQAGGGPDRGIAKWLDALPVFESEHIEDPTKPDWGGALPYGWLANLMLSMTPPDTAQARTMVQKALTLRPDFWWVATQVAPKLGS